MAVTRRHFLSVRLTDDEYLLLRKNAAELRTSPSSYVRLPLSVPAGTLDGSLPQPETLKGSLRVVLYDGCTYRGLERQLRAWGHHHNQAVRALNAVASKEFMSEEDTIEILDRAMGVLEEIERYRIDVCRALSKLPIAQHAPTSRRDAGGPAGILR